MVLLMMNLPKTLFKIKSIKEYYQETFINQLMQERVKTKRSNMKIITLRKRKKMMVSHLKTVQNISLRMEQFISVSGRVMNDMG